MMHALLWIADQSWGTDRPILCIPWSVDLVYYFSLRIYLPHCSNFAWILSLPKQFSCVAAHLYFCFVILRYDKEKNCHVWEMSKANWHVRVADGAKLAC